MPFLAKLKVDNAEYNILKLDYAIEQAADDSGLPNERSQAGIIHVTIESTKNTDFIAWALSNRALKNGDIILYNRDAVSTFRRIEFHKAYCLKFRELFDAIDNKALMSELTISAKKISFKDIDHTNNWPTIA